MNLRGKLTYANVMATIAVFIALGGTGYAAAKINGKNIKASTVAGKALKKNTLTGREIRESKLGKVPSAASADSALAALTASSAAVATTATSAGSVGGASVTPIKKVAPATVTPSISQLFKVGAITIEASCSVANDFPTLTRRSSADNGYTSGYRISVGGTETLHTFDGDFEAGESSTLANGPVGFSTTYTESLRNADGSAATVIVTASKQQQHDSANYECTYTGVAFSY